METKKWGLWILTAFVIGNMVGGGVFMLPANLAHVSGPMGSTLAWSITGLGVFMIALVFGNLAIRKPELKAGPQSYAQAMFPSKRRVQLQDIVWHGDIGLRTGLQQHLLLFPLLDIYQHSFQFYKVSTFSFQRTDFHSNLEKD